MLFRSLQFILKSLFSFSRGFIFIDNYVHVLSLCYFVQIENGNGTRCSEVNGVTVCGEYNLSEEFFNECSDPASEYYFVRDRVRGTLNTPEVS